MQNAVFARVLYERKPLGIAIWFGAAKLVIDKSVAVSVILVFSTLILFQISP
jgi:hypothetical protein